MTDAAARFVLIPDRDAEKDPDHWVVAAEANTLEGVRRLVYPDTAPSRLSRAEFDGEKIEPILLFQPWEGGRRAVAASIWRLSPRSAPAAGRDGGRGAEMPLTEYERATLTIEGIAESDASSYARLQMLGF